MNHLALVPMVLLAATSLAGETVRLDAATAVARALEVALPVAAADARVDAATASIRAADASTRPAAVAAASLARRSSIPEFVLPVAQPGQPATVLLPDITTTWGLNLRVQQVVFSGGAIRAGRDGARAEHVGAVAGRTQVENDLRLSAQAAYWDAVRSAAALATADAQEQRARRLVEDTSALLDAGMAVVADRLAAEERAASARVRTIRATAEADNARAELRSLIHLGPEVEIELADSLAGGLPAPPSGIDELTRRALANRAELTVANARVASIAARERVAHAAGLPAVSLAAQWDDARPNQRTFPLRDEWKSSWSVGAYASWQIFDGGKSASEQGAAQALARAARLDHDELVRRIVLDVEITRRNLESARAAVAAADTARTAGEAREAATRERYQAGLATIAEVLDATSDLAAAEQQQVDARAAAWLAAAALERATGQ